MVGALAGGVADKMWDANHRAGENGRDIDWN